LTEAKIAKLLTPVIRAIAAAAEQSLAHGAILPKNLMVTGEGKLTLTDMGLAGYLKALPVIDCKQADEVEYMAPEVATLWLKEWGKGGDARSSQKIRGSMAPKEAPKEPDKALSAEAKAAKEAEEALAEAQRRIELSEQTINSAVDVWAIGVLLYTLLTGQKPFTGKDRVETANAIMKNEPTPKNVIISASASVLLKAMLQKDPAKRVTIQYLAEHTWFNPSEHTEDVPIPKSVCENLMTFNNERHFKKMMMRLISSRVPPKQVKDLRQAFETLDANGDGQISMTEFTEGLKKQPKLKGAIGEDIEKAFMEIDYTNSGTISLDEFLAATIDSQQNLVENLLFDAFKAVDVDGDGKLTLVELKRVVSSLDGNMGSEHSQMMLNVLEDEVSGAVTFEEFKALVMDEGGRGQNEQAMAARVKEFNQSLCSKMVMHCRQNVIRCPEPQTVVDADQKLDELEKKEKKKTASVSSPNRSTQVRKTQT